MIKLLKDNKGMTLMELIVGMLLFTIVAAAVSSVMVPMLRIQIDANKLAEHNTLIDSVANQIISDLECATKQLDPPLGEDTVEIVIDAPNNVVYTVGDSVLCKDITQGESSPIPVLPQGHYKGNAVGFSYRLVTDFDEEGEPVVPDEIVYELTVALKDKNDLDNILISRTYAVKPLVLNSKKID